MSKSEEEVDFYSDESGSAEVEPGYSSSEEEEEEEEGELEGEAQPYVALTPLQIIEMQQEALRRIQQVLPNVPVFTIRMLLQHFRWDAGKALERYTAGAAALFAELGIEDDVGASESAEGGSGECFVCLEDEEELTGLGCGHACCRACWQEYLELKVREKARVIPCPGASCGRMVDELTLVALLPDEHHKARYKARLVESFVDDNPLVRWCPAPGCENAVMLLEVKEHRNEGVACLCGRLFCFRCGEFSHAPNSCRMVRAWNSKQDGADQKLDLQLIATISRACPRCQAPIQKNGGCSHVECASCSFHFCWRCMKRFGSGPKGGTDGYHTHKCPSEYVEDDSVVSKKEELKRFRSYQELYESHVRSYALEKELAARAEDIISSVCERYGMSRGEVSFYTRALDQLLTNRHLVINTYIYGYFRPTHVEKLTPEVFEYLQKDLVAHTERLSGLLENSDPEAIRMNTRKIQHAHAVAKAAVRMLLLSAAEWSFCDPAEVEPESPSKQEGEEAKAKRKKPASFLRKLFRRQPAN